MGPFAFVRTQTNGENNMPIKFGQIVIETMRIRIKDLNTASMEITDKGLELSLQGTNGKHVGDLIVTPTTLVWNKGKTSKFGKSITWHEFFKLMSERQ